MSYGVFDELKSCAPKFRFELNRDHPKRMKLKHDGASWGIITMPYIMQGISMPCIYSHSRNTTHTHKTPGPLRQAAGEQVPIIAV